MTDSQRPRKALPVPQASPPDENINHAQVADQVRQLDAFVRSRLAELNQAQREHESREKKLADLEQMIRQATSAFAGQITQAQGLTQQLQDAGRAAEQYLADSAQPLAKRLDEIKQLDRSVDQRMARMQQMHKQAGEAVDKFLLRSLRETKEEASELIAPIKQDLDEHLAKQTAALEAKVNEKIAELDVDIEEALAPLTSRFDAAIVQARRQADDLAAGLPSRVEHELANLEADTAKRVRQIAAIAQTAGERIAASLAKVNENARQQADRAGLAHAASQTPATQGATPQPPVVETPPLDSPLRALAQRLKQTPAGAKQDVS